MIVSLQKHPGLPFLFNAISYYAEIAYNRIFDTEGEKRVQLIGELAAYKSIPAIAQSIFEKAHKEINGEQDERE